jgi:hypothetical protein
MTDTKFTRTIVEDPDSPGELMLDLGNEVCDHLGWQPGDVIEWIDNKDGSWTLRKSILPSTTTIL